MAYSTCPAGKVTIGLDLGDTYSHYHSIVTVDHKPVTLDKGRLRTKKEDLQEFFGAVDPARVAIETGTHSRWVSRLLSGLGHEVLVANPRQLPLIYQNHKKSDKVDPENLARLAHTDPSLLRPILHRSEAIQTDLATLRSRDILVAVRTKLINHVRGLLKPFGLRAPSSSAHCFHHKAAAAIPPELEPALGPILKMIGELTRTIDRYETRIKKELAVKYPETKRVQQVPGVGPVTGLAFVLILADPRRFKNSRAVGSYLGLTPRQDDSGDQSPQLRITKAGDPFLRRLLVTSAQYVLGPFGPDCDLKRFGEALAQRGGKSAKKRAVVAVARKLAVLLHRLWVTGERYDPNHKKSRRPKRS
jgi:transposase